jgi:hypothetical protein
MWGGQQELAALTKLLDRQIIVHSAKGESIVANVTCGGGRCPHFLPFLSFLLFGVQVLRW